jgi:hypothetical protein
MTRSDVWGVFQEEMLLVRWEIRCGVCGVVCGMWCAVRGVRYVVCGVPGCVTV